jgi:UDP-N-acetylmuramyl tripeptide synthase
MPLGAEIAVARVAGKLSRLAGAGGGTTVPGKLLWKLDPGAIDRLAARLPEGSAVISATNGKTTTAAMAAGIMRNRFRLAHNSSGANLVSGVASALLDASDAELGLFEVDEGALPEIVARVRPKAVCLGNLFRDQLDRYGELEHVAARWREAVRRLPAETALVVNGDDPQLGALTRVRSGTPPIRSTACSAGRRTTTRPPTWGTSASTSAPPAGTGVPHSTWRPERSS